jgi:hypothetical protein
VKKFEDTLSEFEILKASNKASTTEFEELKVKHKMLEE